MICFDKAEDKQNTTQKTKKMTNNQVSRTVSSSYILGDTRHIADRGKRNLRYKERVHCHLRYGYFVTVTQIVITTVELM